MEVMHGFDAPFAGVRWRVVAVYDTRSFFKGREGLVKRWRDTRCDRPGAHSGPAPPPLRPPSSPGYQWVDRLESWASTLARCAPASASSIVNAATCASWRRAASPRP